MASTSAEGVPSGLGPRWYDQRMGMFRNVDPMSEEYPDMSPYNYALANPMRFTDPSGLSAGPWRPGGIVFDEVIVWGRRDPSVQIIPLVWYDAYYQILFGRERPGQDVIARESGQWWLIRDPGKPQLLTGAPPDVGTKGVKNLRSLWSVLKDLLKHPKSAMSILKPAGRLIGEAGSSSRIRIVKGGVTEARQLFSELSSSGQVLYKPGYPGTLVKLPDGGYIGLREASQSGRPTIDVNIPGLQIKIKFVE